MPAAWQAGRLCTIIFKSIRSHFEIYQNVYFETVYRVLGKRSITVSEKKEDSIIEIPAFAGITANSSTHTAAALSPAASFITIFLPSTSI